MESSTRYRLAEHPQDIFEAALHCNKKAISFALAFVEATDVGSVRRPGAAMLVTETGNCLGYLSGGCIDADVCTQALSAIQSGRSRKIRYGRGSIYIDLSLPCGNGIDIRITPDPNISVIRSVYDLLSSRLPAALFLKEDGVLSLKHDEKSSRFTYVPKMKLRIAGRGHDAIALSRLALESGLSVKLQSPDTEDLNNEIAFLDTEHLHTPMTTADHNDDPYTAFILMFHDVDWESPLLRQALEGPAFFIGAVGSEKTHSKRCCLLRDLGVTKKNIERIKAPIGLIPSMRDSSMLAISALADIAKSFHEVHP